MIGSLRCQLHILYLWSTFLQEGFLSASQVLPHAQEINVLFFLLKLEWFRDRRYVLLNGSSFHKKADWDRRGLEAFLELSHEVFSWIMCTGIIFFLGRGFPGAVTPPLILFLILISERMKVWKALKDCFH